jgi:hypothetical protein
MPGIDGGFTPFNQTLTCNGQQTTVRVSSQDEANTLNKITGGDGDISQTELQNLMKSGPRGHTELGGAVDTQDKGNFETHVRDLPTGMQTNLFNFVVRAQSNTGAAGATDTPREAFNQGRASIRNVIGGNPTWDDNTRNTQTLALANTIMNNTLLSNDDKKVLLDELMTYEPARDSGPMNGGQVHVGNGTMGANTTSYSGVSLEHQASRNIAPAQTLMDQITAMRNSLP